MNEPNCIKAIPYHDILAMREALERLSSWKQPLSLLDQFFSDQRQQVNKKKIIQEYHACALLFQAFHENYDLLIKRETELLYKMVEGKKVPADNRNKP